jgi:hypothetical protein
VRIIQQPVRILATAILTLMTLTGLTVQAAEPPAPPAVLEAFQCSYNSGKDWDDLMDARDYLVKQAGKANIALEPSFVWSQYKGDAPIDFVWFTAHTNLLTFGAAADRNAAASELSGVLDRFYSVADCTAGMGVVTPTFERVAPGENNDGVLVSSFACNLRHGAGPLDMTDLSGHAARVFGAMGDNGPMGSYMIDPITGSNSADRYLFTTFANATDWTKFVGNILGSPDGQMLVRHRDKVLDCNLSLWSAQMVVGSLAEN